LRKAPAVTLEPRKAPRQARSTESVAAIMQAAVQVLLKEGKSRLTTTRIAARAGVSVGTLYQYFPNKSSLLQAVLKEHLERLAEAVEVACEAACGSSLASMGDAVSAAFVRGKLAHAPTSIALYMVSDDVEGKRIARGIQGRMSKAMVAMLETASDRRLLDPGVATLTILSAMAGVSRTMLEQGVHSSTMDDLARELTLMMRSYLGACATVEVR
jgi:AcrR family transcriptional regulator